MIKYLITCSILFSLFSCKEQTETQKEIKPNIVVIFTDDMNYEDIGALGGEVLTPTMDSLMTKGVQLTNFYDCSAVCSPSRFNLLTGKYASRSKALLRQFPKEDPAFLRWNVDIDKGERTMAHVLKENGYYTGFVGKHHNLDNEKLQEHVNPDADMYDEEVQNIIAENYKMLKDTMQATTGFDYVENVYINNLHALELPLSMQYHNMDWITAGGLDFLDKVEDKPFFLYFATTLPHAPAPITSMYADSRITPSGLLDEPLHVQPSREDVIKKVEDAGLPTEQAPYTWLDDAIGTIVSKLEEKGVLENTIILFASDHGGNKAKMTCYEKGARAPAFIYWKDHFLGNTKIDQLTANIDFAPTIYDLCGIQSDENEHIDGESLVPLLNNDTTNWRENLLLEITYSKAIVTDDWKYIAVRFPEETQEKIKNDTTNLYNHEGTLYSSNNPAGKLKVRYKADELYPAYYDYDQLYNLKSDPKEQHNLANDPEYEQVLEKMKLELKSKVSGFNHAFGEFKIN